jgi:hypothetical protein
VAVTETEWVTVASLATALGTLVLRGSDIRVRPLGELLSTRRGPGGSYRRTVCPHRSAFTDGGRAPAANELATLEVADGVEYMVISVRNVGTGLAVMHGWHAEVGVQPQKTHPPLEDFTAQTRDIYVAARDIGFWQGALRDPATAQFKTAAAAIEGGDPMMLTSFTATGTAASE